MVNAEFELIANLGIEGHEGDAFGGLVTLRVPAVDDVGDHLDDGKCFTRTRYGFNDKMALWIVSPLDTRYLFLGQVG